MQLFGDLAVVPFERICPLNWIGHLNRGKDKGKVYPRTSHEGPEWE
jgi:hypothetical protein